MTLRLPDTTSEDTLKNWISRERVSDDVAMNFFFVTILMVLKN